MSKKLIYLICFVLVLALVSTDVAFGGIVWEGQINKHSDEPEELDPSGAPEGGSSDLEFPYEDGGMGDKQIIGLRWEDVDVPKGARIMDAWIEFMVDETGEGTTHVSVIIEGELNPNPPTFTNSTPSEVANRQPRTTAQAIYEPEHWTAVGEKHQTSDIGVVIEEIVNQDGWVRGNALVLIIRDNPANPSKGRRVADSYDGNAQGAPLLHIEYVTSVTRAAQPSPADRAIDMPRDAVLSWTPGDYADKHDVYLGTVFDDVNDASRTNPFGVLISQNQDPNSYSSAELLQFGQTYYWRIDEVNAPPDYTIYKGGVWQFTVEPFAYPIAGENITATASSSNDAEQGPENTINGSGLDADDLHSSENTDMWLSSVIGTQPTWIQYELDKVYKLHQMLVWNHNTSLEIVIGFGIKEAVIEYSTDGASWTTLGTTHEFARATGLPGSAPNTTVDLSGVVAKYVKITANSNWGGLFNQYGLSEVRFFYVPVLAREPDPASGATDTDVEAVLSWRAGREAASHKVYFSADEQAVKDETISPVSIPADSSYANYSTGELDLGQSYYWKVDEVNEAETTATWQGDLWNFGTQEYLVVDDFEDYNDFEPDRIFDMWSDGWTDPTKGGSQVGSDIPPFAEQTIVHDGRQSMPLMYDNSTANYSEATANVANLAIGQDWTRYGIQTLVLYFHGDPGNSVEQLYVKLNGSKVTYDGDAVNLARAWWHLWNIDLTSFGVNPAPVAGVGVNLSNVTELSIGLERIGVAGGMGVLYLDDIRLYRSAPAAPGPVNEWRIAANSDDAEEMVVGLGMDLGSSDLELGHEGGFAPETLQIVGCRWTAIPVPKGATITEAWVQFSADDINDDYHIPEVSLIIEGELFANPATFSSTAGDISSRPTTTAKVVWDIPRWMTVHAKGPEERTPDISSIIQEIVNQDGWVGSAIVLMFRDNPAKPSAGTREAEAIDGSPSDAPLLHITYQ